MPVQPRIPDFDVFETLGVTVDDPPEAVKAAWRRRVKEHHPDAAGGSDDQIKRVNVAYDWLRDPTLRRTYLLATAGLRTLLPEHDLQAVWDAGREARPPTGIAYEGPRADRIDALAERIGMLGMAELVDLVHGYRPDVRWSRALAHAVEATGRSGSGVAAVWQVRRGVLDRVEALLASDEVRAAYDDELVGQVVSDRLADLVRGIVLLDVLTPGARARVSAEWSAIMGPDTGPPGDEPGLGVRLGGVSRVAASWSRAPEALRWIAGILVAGLAATAATALLPSQAAAVLILLGLGVGATLVLARRPPSA